MRAAWKLLMNTLTMTTMILVVLTVVACNNASQQQRPIDVKERLVDLTYAFDARTIYWPNAQPFKWEEESWGKSAGGYWYAAARYSASEHGGTHLDSPIHFSEGKLTIDAIPVERLIGPAIVIDITAACARNSDHADDRYGNHKLGKDQRSDSGFGNRACAHGVGAILAR